MMEDKPLVSIIVNCYNGEKYLRETIDSILNQTYHNYEVIFWDNQSTDSTASIIKSYKNERFNFYYAPKHTHCILLILAMEFLFVTGFTALLFRGTLSAGTQKNCFSGQNYPPSRQLHLVLLRYIRKIRFTDNQRSSNESKQA